MNSIEEFQTYDVDVYVNTMTPNEFFGDPRLKQYGQKATKKPRILSAKPDWSLRSLNFTMINELELGTHSFNYTVDLNKDTGLHRQVL